MGGEAAILFGMFEKEGVKNGEKQFKHRPLGTCRECESLLEYSVGSCAATCSPEYAHFVETSVSRDKYTKAVYYISSNLIWTSGL